MPTSQETLSSETNQHKNLIPILICLALTILTVIIFWPLKDYDFINFDDNVYVYENADVQSGLNWNSIKQAFSSELAEKSGFWHPVTWLSLMLDYQIFGLNPNGYHLINLLLHVINTVLLFLILHRMTKTLWSSAFVAALFAIHPLHVESVAWVAERKDVLSTFFWMLTMGSYALYVEKLSQFRYCLVLGCCILGMMAKPMLITLPFVLLLFDWWPLGRFSFTNGNFKQSGHEKVEFSADVFSQHRNYKNLVQPNLPYLIVEKIPLFIIAIIFILVTYFAEQKVGALKSLTSYPFYLRISNVLVSYVTYIWRMFWPFGLAVFYPNPGNWSIWVVILSGLILLMISVFVLYLSKSFPFLTVGWLWYLGTLVPVIGIIQIGSFATADRYTYIPLIGLFIMISYGSIYIFKRYHLNRIILLILSFMFLSFLSICTVNQLNYWRDSATLFQHTNTIVRDNYLCHYNFGMALKEKGDLDGAIRQYRMAISLNNKNASIHNNLAVALISKGDFQNALTELGTAINLKPDYAGAYNNTGMILYQQGHFNEAITYFRAAIKIQPNYANAQFYLAVSLERQGYKKEAEAHYTIAMNINPIFKKMKSGLFNKKY
jgi:hypothetical protein